VLDTRSWSESRLAKESGITRSVVSEHVSGERPVSVKDLTRYMKGLSHQEPPQLFSAWIRDNLPTDLVQDLLNVENKLTSDVTGWVPILEDESKRMLSWCAREIARDPEWETFFKLLCVMGGYRSEST
jgi:hypothetical protein